MTLSLTIFIQQSYAMLYLLYLALFFNEMMCVDFSSMSMSFSDETQTTAGSHVQERESSDGGDVSLTHSG